MSNDTLWDNKYVIVDNFRVHRSGRVDFKVGDDWEECQTFTTCSKGYSECIPLMRVRYINKNGVGTHTSLFAVLMRAITGIDDTRTYFARPIDGDVRNCHYLNMVILEGRKELEEYNEKLLDEGYYCNSCHTYNRKGGRCKGCERYVSYLEELSEIYPNLKYLKKSYRNILKIYLDGGTNEDIISEIVGFCGSIQVLETRLDRMYDANHIIWESSYFSWLYHKIIIDDTITANDLVHAKMTVDEFIDKVKDINPNLEYMLYNGEVRGNDISILIKESALID